VSFVASGGLTVSGPVTCLNVDGPDQGAGRPGAPTTAVLAFDSSQGPTDFGIVTVLIIDNGGNGTDIFVPRIFGSGDCSPFGAAPTPEFTLASGRAVVFDASVVPTSKDQRMNGGHVSFGFKNQGECVAFVERGPKPKP
jgi:hypothetical protein